MLPEQIGVGVKDACESAIHAPREITKKYQPNGSLVFTIVELTNASTTVEGKKKFYICSGSSSENFQVDYFMLR